MSLLWNVSPSEMFYVSSFRIDPFTFCIIQTPESTCVSHRTPIELWRPERLSDAKNIPEPSRMMGYATRLQSGKLTWQNGEKGRWRVRWRQKRGGSRCIYWCVFLHWDRSDRFSRCVPPEGFLQEPKSFWLLEHPVKKNNKLGKRLSGFTNNKFCFDLRVSWPILIVCFILHQLYTYNSTTVNSS